MKPDRTRPARARVLSCGILRLELSNLPRDLREVLDYEFLDSMLHMDPARLDSELDSLLSRDRTVPTILLFGDCSAHMREYAGTPGRIRTDGTNCLELLLGRDRYRKLRAEGVFLLLPEWAPRWRRIFEDEMGFRDRDSARAMMRESLRSLAYLDTGILPVPRDTLRELQEYFDMPVSVEPVGLDNLEAALRKALKDLGIKPDARIPLPG